MAAFKPAKFASAATFRPASFAKPAETVSVPDPLAGYEYTGDIEADSAAEMSAMKAGFIARAQQENKRREKATDSEYWVCMCFQSREQVEEFLRRTGWGLPTDKYIDGQRVATALGVDIPPEEEPLTERVRISPDWADLSMRE